MARIIIIRHGETDYNLQNRYYGFSDPPLNDRGIWQAGRLAQRMRDEKIDVVYSSDLKRAYQTAKIIFNPSMVRQCSPSTPSNVEGSTSLMVNGERSRTIKDRALEELAGFREMNFGIFEGWRHEDAVQRRPKLYKDWIADPVKVKIPGAEALKQFCLRVRQSFSLILSRHQGKSLAIVAHAGPIKVILGDCLDYTMEQFWKIEQSVGALNILEYSEKSAIKVIKINDTSHLS